jgi:hypothetical protein
VFPALLRLRRTHPGRPRAFRVPGGAAGAVAASALATGWSAVALAASLWPGLGTGDPDAHLPDGFAGQRLSFTLAELVPLAAVLGSAALLVHLGRRQEPTKSGVTPCRLSWSYRRRGDRSGWPRPSSASSTIRRRTC